MKTKPFNIMLIVSASICTLLNVCCVHAAVSDLVCSSPSSANSTKTVITFGTYDLFHYGHLEILRRAKALAPNGQLIVGVSSDSFTFHKKQKIPRYSEKERLAIVAACSFVSEVFLEESMEKKADYCAQYKADILVMGDDWENKFDHLQSSILQVVYLPRTPNISTTNIIENIRKEK